MNLIVWIFTHKLLVVLIAVIISLALSTIILAIENRKLRNEIDELIAKETNLTEMNKYRLPGMVKPILYELYFYPNLSTGLFKGKVDISVDILSTTDSISLHSHTLNIDNVHISSENGTYSLDQSYQLLTIRKTDQSNFTPGKENLQIEFSGDMKNRIVGLYTSSYKDANGESRRMATSKFEPTYARQAFPCFDEPNMKAKYKVHLLKPKDNSYIALSNFPVSNITDYDKENQLVSFEETVSMSTYLSCFIVSDFAHTETSFNNDGKMIPLKVYASPDNLQKTQYAGEVGKKVIEYYVNYFQIPYPLPKLDMVAIPDFVSGAMEHWGLVTYRETALLYTNTTHSTINKQRVTTVVAHELAHSWFGNLVTMNWWNDLWLNEGFASYIQYKGASAAEPTWGLLDQFMLDLHAALNFDSRLSSHPIVQTVLTPDQISEIFDLISYKKGASILRMLENTVKETTFQQAVKNYLNLYAYKNAITEDFLDEVQKLVGTVLNVKELMETFTVQMGYPILTVTRSGDEYTLTQKRFLADSTASFNKSDSAYRYRWSVPVTYITDLGKSSSFVLFNYNADSIKITRPTGAKWMKFNHDQIGYYRVNYPKAEWDDLIAHYGNFSVADRTHLLEEAFSIAEADLLDFEVPLELTKKLSAEFDYMPWSVAYIKLRSILNHLKWSGSDQEAAFKKYVIDIVSPAYNNFSWNETVDYSHLDRLARIEIFYLACLVDHEACLSEAQSYFNRWLKTRQPITPDLRRIIYSNGMKKANKTTWDALLEIYKNETDASERLKLMKGLTSIENEDILKKLLELAKDETLVRSQDFFSVVQFISINPSGTDLVWNWVRSNWDYLVHRFTLNDRYLGTLIPEITSTFATQERLTEIEEFFKEHPNAGAGVASRARALEKVKHNILWLSKNKKTVEKWIRKNSVL
ncbi:unnamed protein product [Psylliodes chrysocephalus]|uniref:Aminopeptidase n=1 Tax=Psylliodes chrysocephalus TaxID=3402493 RepID=A0A9P0D0I1_9CUCU|nr:unnamed protein product [Psylliodes chrysocephala]